MTNSLKYGTGEWIAIISFYFKKRLEFFKTTSDIAKNYKEVKRFRPAVKLATYVYTDKLTSAPVNKQTLDSQYNLHIYMLSVRQLLVIFVALKYR